MNSERHLDTARHAARRAGVAGLVLGLAGAIAAALSEGRVYEIAPLWWPLLALLLPLVTVCERWLGPIRKGYAILFVSSLALLAHAFLLERFYLQGVLEGQSAVEIARLLALQLEMWWLSIPTLPITWAAGVAAPLCVLAWQRRERVDLGWQLASPVLVVLCVNLLGATALEVPRLYGVREFSAAQVEAYGLGFDLTTFLKFALEACAPLSIPVVLACVSYAASAWWGERVAARAASLDPLALARAAERAASAGPR